MSAAPTLSPESFKTLLKKLHATPSDFTADDVSLAMEHLLHDPPTPTPEQIGAFLSALKLTGVELLPSTLATAADALLKRAIIPRVDSDVHAVRADMVGTGGDGHNVFNVSTTAAIVAAGAGLRVLKHGNYAATSSSGSADLLLSLGCALAQKSVELPANLPFQFLLASTYHPALAGLGPLRKQLPFRTLFNLLGPLANPVRPTHMVLGVAAPKLGPLFAQALVEQRHGRVHRALVVCGEEGLDEISCAGPSRIWTVDGETGTVTESVVTPEDFGLSRYSLDTVRGHSPSANAEVLKELLRPNYTSPDREVPIDLVPVRAFVCMNASALLVVAGLAKDWKDGVRLALESITSGKAWDAIDAFRAGSIEAMDLQSPAPK
ncbi:anthranilate phosphoribosyltransferase, TrpD [Auriculariales sp. MPI-PUGE-AT-0066]|nr:anthranilate phosphoribosyltransferase, TrpD [Auriculariales sp. MPI-PUGE-AT-0066]